MNLLTKLFGSTQEKNEQANKPAGSASATKNETDQANKYIAKWEQERKERIRKYEMEHKEWLLDKLHSNNDKLPFTWESGNDEAFVTFENKNDEEEDNFMELEEYVIARLDIPDAGEFEMNGKGVMYIEFNVVKVKYSSSIKGVIDYNEETDEAVHSESEEDSGDEILFAM